MIFCNFLKRNGLMPYKNMRHIVHIIYGALTKDVQIVMTIMVRNRSKFFNCCQILLKSSNIILETKAKPLGCMSDALSSASASFEVLQRQLNDCTNAVEQLQRVVSPSKVSDQYTATLSTSITAMMVSKIEMSYLVNFYFDFYFCFTLFQSFSILNF